MKYFNKKKQSGFTIAEVLMAIIILGIILSVAVPNLLQKMKDTESISFPNELKILESNIKQVSNVNNENYGHIPHPNLIDKATIDSDFNSKSINKEDGFPYLSTANPDNDTNYFIIRLSGTGNSTVEKGGLTTKYDIPHSLDNALKTHYGRNAVLRAYAIDMLRLSYYSPTPIKVGFPKNKMIMSTMSSNPYTLNGYQKDLVQGYSPKSVFGVGCPNPTSTVSGTSVPCYMSIIGYATDANDRIPKDNIVEKPGYYIVVIGGNKQRVFYTGTDAIYKNKYIHTY